MLSGVGGSAATSSSTRCSMSMTMRTMISGTLRTMISGTMATATLVGMILTTGVPVICMIEIGEATVSLIGALIGALIAMMVAAKATVADLSGVNLDLSAAHMSRMTASTETVGTVTVETTHDMAGSTVMAVGPKATHGALAGAMTTGKTRGMSGMMTE